MPEAVVFVAFLEASVRLGVPLALAAMGETITERSGVINIGLEGSLIAGALGGALGAMALDGPGGGLLIGAAAGALVAFTFAAFAIGLGTDQFFPVTDDFTLGGIAAGTIIIVAGYHLARAIAPPEPDGTMLSVGTEGVHHDGPQAHPDPEGRHRG